MMKTFILLSFCLLSLCLCQAQNKQYTIKGHIDGKCEGMKVLLQTSHSRETVNTAVIRNNSFEMQGQVPAPGMYNWIIDKTPAGKESDGDNWLGGTFYLENSDITFTGNIATLPIYYWDPEGYKKTPMVIRGSATEDLNQEYKNSIAKQRKEYAQLDNEYLEKYHIPSDQGIFNTAEGIRLARQISALSSEIDEITLRFIRQHPESIVSYDLATYFLDGDSKLTVAQIDELVQALGKTRGDSPQMKEFEAKAAKSVKSAIGEPYKDIELLNTEWKPVKLSQFIPKGKYVMLEFWASWCGPCRGEIPHLKHVYKEYKDKGFEIVSVSIDEKNKDWQKALQEEKMSWTQLDDPEGTKQGPAQQIYNVTGVPYCILLDKEGRIYKTGMRGAFLDAELERLLP